MNRPIIDRLSRVISRGQAEGSFQRDIDPVEVHKAMAALGVFDVTNQYTCARSSSGAWERGSSWK